MELRHHMIAVARAARTIGIIASLAVPATTSACNKVDSPSSQRQGSSPLEPEPRTNHAAGDSATDQSGANQPGAEMPEARTSETKTQAPPRLEDGAVLLFEKISLGNEPEANRRWRVDGDGTVWFSKNRPPVPEGQDFNQPLTKLAKISPEQRDQLLRLARESGFWEAEEHQVDPAVEDGMRWQLTIRDGDKVRRIQADNIVSPAIDAVTQSLFAML